MKTKLFFISLIAIISTQCLSQSLRNKHWVIGSARGVLTTFNDTARPNNKIIYDFPPPYYYADGASNICDSATGELLFSTTGMLIHDTTGAIMENGDSLVDPKIYNHNFYPASFNTQASLILPKGNNGQYYVFICTISDSAYTYYYNIPNSSIFAYDRLEYSIVDISANNGLGKVIAKRKKLLQGVAIQKVMMQACRHSNGVDWWLLKQGEYDTNRIYRFLVKADTIEGPWVQNFAAPKYPAADLYGQYAFSKDGTKFASVQGWRVNKLFLADFDRCTGELNNPKIINIPLDSITTAQPPFNNVGQLDRLNAGVCFSPNGQFVYISKEWNIYQYKLNEPDSSLAWYRVKHGPDTSYAFQGYSQLLLGMDGRIYIGNQGGQLRQMSVIDKPDIKGIGCQFCRKCFRLDTNNISVAITCPPNMPDYNLGASGQPCWPVANNDISMKNEELEVYPNPTSSKLIIENAKGKEKELYNMQGQLIISTKENEIDVSRCSKGVYYIRCNGQVRKVVVD